MILVEIILYLLTHVSGEEPLKLYRTRICKHYDLTLSTIYGIIWAFHGYIFNSLIKCKRISKKLKIETILEILRYIGLDHVDIWFQDEDRFGKKNTSLYAEVGT